MAGTAIKLIDKLIAEKSKGDQVVANGIKVKLIVKGIPVAKLTASTPDDPAVIEQIKTVAKEFGVTV